MLGFVWTSLYLGYVWALIWQKLKKEMYNFGEPYKDIEKLSIIFNQTELTHIYYKSFLKKS